MLIIDVTLEQTNDDLLKKNIGTIIKHSMLNGQIDEDLFNVQLENFYNVKEEFDETMGVKFNTFLYTYLKNMKSNYIRDNSVNDDSEVALTDELKRQLKSGVDLEKELIQNETAKLIMEEIEKLSEKEQYVLKERIFNSKTLKEIGEEIGYSKQGVRRMYNRKICKIREELEGRI